MIDILLFSVFPYLAVLLAVVIGIYRYFNDRFSYSSQSSQFLENRQLFWGSVPWHYGVLLILLGHLLAALFPGTWVQLLGDTTRLYVLEISGFALGILTVVGMVLLIIRRLVFVRIRVTSTVPDWLLLVILILQVASGLYIAIAHRWGGLWYVYTAVPWLKSLLYLNPRIEAIAPLPWIIKFHLINAFVLVLIFPFTRLVHVVSLPLSYLWRPYQVVIWNRKKGWLKKPGIR